jgi:2-desacetyl-2-hydroxyethyl bacteriochlorophyllide A dehydrogenase
LGYIPHGRINGISANYPRSNGIRMGATNSVSTMNAVVCETPGHLIMERRPVPTRAEGEVLLRIRRVGICGTDMHIVRGTQPYLSYPRVMGHELAAEVVEAPGGSALKPGDRVFVMPYLACKKCSACLVGKTNCCRNLQVLGVHRDGGLAEYLTVPSEFALKADGLTLDQIAMVEFLSIGAHAVERGNPKPKQRVLVVGAGPIGIAVLLFAKMRDAQVFVLDTRTDRLDFCRNELGVEVAVLADDQAGNKLSELTAGDMFDVVFDATGNRLAMQAGFSYVANGGSYVLVSIVNGDITFSDPEFHRRETTLLGSRNATVADVERVMNAIRTGRVPTAKLNTHRAAFADIPKIFSEWMDPAAGVIKAIVEC